MTFQIKKLGRLSYDDGLALMNDLHAQRVSGEIEDQLLVLEHEPVITRGRKLAGQALPGQESIEAKGIQVRDADRGGELTYHGPGQLVVYFILKVDDHFKGAADMVHSIENALITAMKTLGLEAHADPENPGLWVGKKKIGSIGLRVASGVSRHGISLNINPDMSVYNLFSPCGMGGETMAALQDLVPCCDFESVTKTVIKELAKL